jgi:alkanesulfonate monooxygenase SsuD/methylene tetrahydromethanopterin reductase-like flavin-dependent oxidoreductase (luciferase family)
VKVGVVVPMSQSDGPGRIPTWAEVRAFAAHAEAIGVDSLWVCDHLISGPPGQPPEGIHEGWTILTALAASTKCVELGQLVMCSALRNPGLSAKMAVTADAVSGGRFILGLGAGWYDPEYKAFGYPTDHRVSRFEEALLIMTPLLRGDRVSFDGRFHKVRNAVLLPAADRPIPILIAAKAPRMLRLTARYADAWNTAWYGLPDDRLRERLADFDAALAAEHRDPTSVRRTVGVEVVDLAVADADDRTDTAIPSSVEALVEAVDAYEELAFDDLIIGLRPPTMRSLDQLATALRERRR